MEIRNKVAMVTGANAGIGKEVARQLALSGDYDKIILACRDAVKAEKALRELESSTGKAIFQILSMDLSKTRSVRSAVASLDESIDHLIMNAGSLGGKTPFVLTEDGVAEIFASNVLGHVVLFETLMSRRLLKAAAIYAGSEAARGVPKLGIKRPALSTSSVEEFVSVCNGTYFKSHKTDSGSAYGLVKYVAAMWMATAARQTKDLKLVTISPGNTRGTKLARDFPLPLRLLFKMLSPLRGLKDHGIDVGANRMTLGLHDATLENGAFYGSRENTLIGPLIEQAEIFPDLSNQSFQNNAFRAVQMFASAR
jgi:NAD(P)-dependent dehydrogenase (short-subunit alcohol dehydrogenase family)